MVGVVSNDTSTAQIRSVFRRYEYNLVILTVMGLCFTLYKLLGFMIN